MGRISLGGGRSKNAKQGSEASRGPTEIRPEPRKRSRWGSRDTEAVHGEACGGCGGGGAVLLLLLMLLSSK